MNKSIAVLNNLIEINIDRGEGYAAAANETDEEDLKILFPQLQQTSWQFKEILCKEVERLGGMPADCTKITNGFYEIWTAIKTALTNKDRKELLKLCEHAEQLAVKSYDQTLNSITDDITPEQLSILRMQHLLIKAEHRKVKTLCDMLAAN
ncbi:PA2169 family four-helix-bundle protein [Ferruginibacter sp.]